MQDLQFFMACPPSLLRRRKKQRFMELLLPLTAYAYGWTGAEVSATRDRAFRCSFIYCFCTFFVLQLES